MFMDVHLKSHLDQVPRVLPILEREESVRVSGRTSTSRTPDSVNVVLDSVGEVIVDNLRQKKGGI